jgi:hypothetical protein
MPVPAVTTKTDNYTLLGSDINKIFAMNATAAKAFTLPAARAFPSEAWYRLKNIGSAILTLTGTVEGSANPTLIPLENILIFSDGTSWYSNRLVSVPRGYLAGLGLSNATDTEHDITVAVGTCKDSTNAVTLTLASALTKQIDAAWAAGSAAGGMFVGAGVQNATWYHLHSIRKDSDGSIDAGFDTSITAANKPEGYTYYRRLGSVLTDGSANILQFIQTGDLFQWKTPIVDANAAAVHADDPAATITLSVPTGLKIKALMIGLCNTTGCKIYDPDLTAAPANYNFFNSANAEGGEVEVMTNTSAQVKAISSSNTGTLTIETLGYTDHRGRNE